MTDNIDTDPLVRDLWLEAFTPAIGTATELANQLAWREGWRANLAREACLEFTEQLHQIARMERDPA